MAQSPLSDTTYHIKNNSRGPKTGNLRLFLSQLFQNAEAEYASFTFTLNAIDPLNYLQLCWQPGDFQFYWEKPSDEFAIAAGGIVEDISASGNARFETINKIVRTIQENTAEYSSVPHSHSGMMFLGGFSFFNHVSEGIWDNFKPASFTVPKWSIIKDGKFNLVTLSVKIANFDSAEVLHRHLVDKFAHIRNICRLESNKNGQKTASDSSGRPMSLSNNRKEEYHSWTSSVEKATDFIKGNSFDKIVLARKVTIDNYDSLRATQVLDNLRNRYHNCYNFLVHRSGSTFLGSTPERLGAFRSRLFLTEALAGSIQRGQTLEEDTELGEFLTQSEKNQNEHNFVIKDIEERLVPYTTDFYRNQQPEIKKLSNVQHLYTPIRAHLAQEANVLEVIGRLHPTPAVGGYPWKKAAPYIEELEDFHRGWYASPVGWINSKGMGEFVVGIRSGLLNEEKAHFFAGCGIVADSKPEAEWKETNLKLKPMLSALQYD